MIAPPIALILLRSRGRRRAAAARSARAAARGRASVRGAVVRVRRGRRRRRPGRHGARDARDPPRAHGAQRREPRQRRPGARGARLRQAPGRQARRGGAGVPRRRGAGAGAAGRPRRPVARAAAEGAAVDSGEPRRERDRPLGVSRDRAWRAQRARSGDDRRAARGVRVGLGDRVALVARHGGLLLHDIEEWLGPAHHRSASLALFLLLLLLPVATFQGWGWLPLWWLSLLFSYFGGPRALARGRAGARRAARRTGRRARSRGGCAPARNPLYHAALAATESVPDAAAIASLEQALQQDPADKDLVYLVGAGRKKAGRYDEAAELYRQALAADPQDAVARNNLANLEFARGGFDAASARYRAGTSLAAGGRGRHLPLQPVARAPAEVRLPGLQRGQVGRRPHRAGARRRLRPLEVRHGRVRGRGHRPRARAGLREVRGGRVGSRRAQRPAWASRSRAASAAARGAAQPLRGVARGASRWPGSWSRAGAGARPSRCTAAAAAPPSAGCATSGR